MLRTRRSAVRTPLTGTARQERQQRGTITIGNPVRGAFEPNGYVNKSRDMVTPAVYPRLFSHHFDIQSSAWTLGNLKGVEMDVYPRLFEIASL